MMLERTQMKLMQIGEVSRLSGLPVRTVHYYEERGLLEPAARTEAGYRLYGQEELARLRFINRAKLLGLTLEETRKLVSLAAGCNRGEIVSDLEDILEDKLQETERRMSALAAFKENLLYYQKRLSETEPEELCGEETSFCGCVDAVTDTAPEDRSCSSAPT
jgi:MerR family copper efflux transcriptional regulator